MLRTLSEQIVGYSDSKQTSLCKITYDGVILRKVLEATACIYDTSDPKTIELL